MNSITHGLTVFSLLFKRDMKAYLKELPSSLINGAVMVFFQIIMLQYFLTTQGLEPRFIVPLFLGYALVSCFAIGFQISLSLSMDLENTNIFRYHYSIVGARAWVIVAYIASSIIKLFVLTIFTGMTGLLFLHHHSIITIHIPYFITIYSLILLFFALMFFTTGVAFSPEMHMDHLWARIIGVMFTFGALFYTIKRVYSFSPWLGFVFLFSPITYCTEGLRGALLGFSEYLHPVLCISVLSVSIIILMILSSLAIRNRLDPV